MGGCKIKPPAYNKSIYKNVYVLMEAKNNPCIYTNFFSLNVINAPTTYTKYTSWNKQAFITHLNEKVIQDFSSTRCIDPKTHVIEAKEIMASKFTITWLV